MVSKAMVEMTKFDVSEVERNVGLTLQKHIGKDSCTRCILYSRGINETVFEVIVVAETVHVW